MYRFEIPAYAAIRQYPHTFLQNIDDLQERQVIKLTKEPVLFPFCPFCHKGYFPDILSEHINDIARVPERDLSQQNSFNQLR